MKPVMIAAFGAASLLAMQAVAQPAPPPPGGGPDAPPPPPRADMPMPPPPPRGPHVRIRPGGDIDIKCAETDTTRACADIVLQIMDKAFPGGMPRPAPGDAPPPPPPPRR